MKLLIATTNPHKLREIRAVLVNLPVEPISLADFPSIAEPEETGQTFEENARLKARHYGTASRLMTVAEDSGLAIDALDGEPGVRSARFLRADASYPERFAEIYRQMAESADRRTTARFVCAIAVARGGAIAFEATGTVEGHIVNPPRGLAGFGYDPIFHYAPFGCTLAEVAEVAKLRVAHRGVAFRKLADWLRTSEMHGHVDSGT